MRTIRMVGSVFVALSILFASAGAHAQQANTSLDGILHIVWGDPHPEFGVGGATRYTLELSDGSSVPLLLTGQEGVAAHHFGKRVIVSGQAVPNQLGIAHIRSPWAFVVDAIAPAAAPQADQGVQASVLGTRKVIFLLLRFSDDAAVPHPPAFYTNLTNPNTPPAGESFPATINGFFRKTSWNQLDWQAVVGGMGGLGAPGGWLTLPHPKSYYAPCGWNDACADLDAIADDGTALGRAQGINFTSYDNINFVLSNDLDCCAYGGDYTSAVDGKSYGATWEPPWGQETGTYAHEMGHSLGLPHSGWVYYSYDSPWDTMSGGSVASRALCGSYNSANDGGSSSVYCDEPGGGYIAAYKNYLGWIPSANQVVTDTSASLTVTLEGDALPLGAATKMIKICLAGVPCSGSSAHYFTVESRVKGLGATSQYDNGIPGEGVIIHEFVGNRAAISGHCYFNDQSGWAVPIDSTPNDYDSVHCNAGGRMYPNYALFNAQWTPGRTYTNTAYGLIVAVVSRMGSAFVVTVGTQNVQFGGPGDVPVPADYDGDGKTDHAVYRPATGDWFIFGSATGFRTINFGAPASSGLGDTPVPRDYDGDGKADVAIYRQTTGDWFIFGSATGFRTTNFGAPAGSGLGDTPVPADYDGDGKADIAIYRQATGGWFIFGSASGFHTTNFGAPASSGLGDTPVPADYDGDHKADVALYRKATGDWFIFGTSTGFYTTNFGAPASSGLGDTPVPADYDGDGRTDLALRRTASNTWFVFRSSLGFLQQVWGVSTDLSAVGDFDGDGKRNIAVWRPSNGAWLVFP